MVYAKFFHPGMSLWVLFRVPNGHKGDKRCKNAQEHALSGLKVIHNRAEINKNVEEVGITEYWVPGLYTLTITKSDPWSVPFVPGGLNN